MAVTGRRHTSLNRGAASELIAAALFCLTGHEIYFGVDGSRHDFIACLGRTVLRVQVKTAWWDKKDRVWISRIDSRKYAGPDSWDKLLIVSPKGHVWDVPKKIGLSKQVIKMRPGAVYAGHRSDNWLIAP